MKISFENSQMHSQGLVLSQAWHNWGEMVMEEEWKYSLRWVLEKRAGSKSMICHHWEIFKLLFIMHNVKPIWIETNVLREIALDTGNYYKVYLLYHLID